MLKRNASSKPAPQWKLRESIMERFPTGGACFRKMCHNRERIPYAEPGLALPGLGPLVVIIQHSVPLERSAIQIRISGRAGLLGSEAKLCRHHAGQQCNDLLLPFRSAELALRELIDFGAKQTQTRPELIAGGNGLGLFGIHDLPLLLARKSGRGECASSLWPLVCRPFRVRQVHGCIDEPDVAKGLGKIPDEPTCVRIVLLGEETDIIAESQQSFERLLGVGVAAEQGIVVSQPKRARQKCPLARRQAINTRITLVALNKSIVKQATLNGVHGATHARIVRRQETHERCHQETGIQFPGAVVLHEGPQFGVEAFAAHLLVNGVTQLAPAIDGASAAKALGRLHRTVQSHPGHDAGMREMAAWTTNLPDPLVGTAPGRLEEFENGLPKPPT